MESEKLDFREFVNNSAMSDWEVSHMYLYNPEMKVKDIAARTNRSTTAIYRIISSFGNRPNRQVTNHDNVLAFARSGLPVKHVADLTGYTQRNVRHILSKSN